MNNIDYIEALVHQINLCQNTQCPLTVWVHSSRHFEWFSSAEISISWYDCHNDSSLWLCISLAKFLNLLLNVFWLVSNWNLGQSWQINQSQINNRLWTDHHGDWFIRYVFIPATNDIRLHLNLLPDFVVVSKDNISLMLEQDSVLSGRGRVDQLDNNRTPRHNISSSWQKVSSHNTFQDRWFTAGLAANHNDLRHVNSEWQLRLLKNKLQLVNDRY